MDIDWLLSLKLGYTAVLNDTLSVKCCQFRWELETNMIVNPNRTWGQIYL